MGHGGALHVPCLEGFDSPTVHQSALETLKVKPTLVKWFKSVRVRPGAPNVGQASD